MSLSVLGRSLVLYAAGIALACAGEPRLPLDLPAGPLLGCLERLSAAAGVRIVDASDRATAARCTPLRASLTLAEALDRVLAPAGLRWERRDDGTIEVLAAERARMDLDPLSVAGTTAEPPPRPDGHAPTVLVARSTAATTLDHVWLDTAPLLGFDQIGRFAPNIYSSGAGLSIRGTERDTDVYPALTISYDGIDLGTRLLDDELVPLDDIDRIVLARGPRSFEEGGESAAGAVRLITKSPTPDATLRTTLGLGTDGARHAGANWSGPIGATGLGLSVGIERRVLPDFITQRVVPAADQGERTNDAAHFKLEYLPDFLPGLTAELAGLGLSGNSSDRWIEKPANGQHFNFGDRISYARQPVVAHTHARGVSARVGYRVSDALEVQVSAANTAIARRGFVYPEQSIESLDTESRRRIGADVRWAFAPDWELVVGAERADAGLHRVLYTFGPAAQPTPRRLFFQTESDPSFARRSMRVWLEHAFSEHWTAGVGVRWQREHVMQHVTESECGVDVHQPCNNHYLRDELGEAKSRLPIPMAVVEWTPLDNQTFALTHGRGYRSAGSIAVDLQYPEERDQSTEATWRAQWLDAKLRTTATAFKSRARDRFTYLRSDYSADLRGRGLELEAEYDLSERWRARAGYGQLDSRYVRRRGAPPYDLGGRVTSGAPPRTAVLGVRYGADAGWYGSLDAYRASSAESIERSFQRLYRPAYTVVDLRVGLRRGGWDTALIVGNAFDKTYIDRAEQAIIPYLSRAVERYRLGDPRRVELRTSIAW